MTKTLLKEADRFRGYQMSTDKVDRETKYVQSSDAEDHLLCSSCEGYFSLLETIMCNGTHNALWDVRKKDWFEWQEVDDGSLATVNRVDGFTFRLFVSSIIWRCGISKSYVASRFFLDTQIEKQLRSILVEYKSIKSSELVSKVKGSTISFPFSFSLAAIRDIEEVNGKIVFLHPSSATEGYFILNSYILTYSFEDEKGVKELINSCTSNDTIKILFVGSNLWNQLHDKLVVKFGNKALDYLKREDKEYFGIRR
ncbi:hypothetical protein FBD94_20675 [Pedobacter hiemivivus]|uniref:Uncharacterized protein n=2 Tax=Pedobacter hiemivivus TaxID=2530454 RepID=A0A4U1G504_9SPHI|nr:hypothetical protein FBD94_20675 [Pedobacter hiemivivus]